MVNRPHQAELTEQSHCKSKKASTSNLLSSKLAIVNIYQYCSQEHLTQVRIGYLDDIYI